MGLRAMVRRAFGLRASDPALNEGYWTTIGEAGLPSASGLRVSAESAMRVSAVYRCVSILANSAAQLPGGVYRRLAQGRQELPDHPVQRLLWKRPNPYQRAFEFKRVMMAWAILRGSAFARIYRRGGELELWPLHPDRMRGPEMLPDGSRRYHYKRPDTGLEEPLLADWDVLVVNGLSLDGLRGLALSDLARETVGLAASTEQYGATLFGRGARFSGGLKLPAGKTIANPKARRALSDSIRSMGAGPYNSDTGEGWWGVPIFEDGMEWQSISMSNDDAQFLETRRFTISDIARWFGVPPHLIGDVERTTSWGTGIEQQQIAFVTYGLMPWLTLFEQSFEETLITEPDLYLRFNVAGLLRADTETRFRVYGMGIDRGILSPNECRSLEELNPRDGGDVYVTPTAPQQSPRTEQAAKPETPERKQEEPEEEPEAREDLHARALRAVRQGAALLGVPGEAVRKMIAHAKPREREHA